MIRAVGMLGVGFSAMCYGYRFGHYAICYKSTLDFGRYNNRDDIGYDGSSLFRDVKKTIQLLEPFEPRNRRIRLHGLVNTETGQRYSNILYILCLLAGSLRCNFIAKLRFR